MPAASDRKIVYSHHHDACFCYQVYYNTVAPVNIQTIPFSISVLKHDPEQQHTKKKDVLVLTRARRLQPFFRIKHIAWGLYTALNIGKRLNV